MFLQLENKELADLKLFVPNCAGRTEENEGSSEMLVALAAWLLAVLSSSEVIRSSLCPGCGISNATTIWDSVSCKDTSMLLFFIIGADNVRSRVGAGSVGVALKENARRVSIECTG